MSQPWILMCPPDHFGIEYEINPWMSRSSQADRLIAAQQWLDLKQILEDAGARISLMEAVAGLPDLVFTANAAMIYQKKAVLARFRHPERQGEEHHDQHWLEAEGFEVLRVPGSTYFEGAGDALFAGDTLFAGYRFRSDARGHQDVGALIGCRVIPLELVDGRYYHLDTCLCPLSAHQAIFYPGRVRQLWPTGAGRPDTGPDPGRKVRSRAVCLQRGGRRPDSRDQHRLGRVARSTARPRFHAGGNSAGRIRQIGGQCQMPHAAARRRRSRRLEIGYGCLSSTNSGGPSEMVSRSILPVNLNGQS